MLRIYKLPNGKTYQFEEGEQPAGAVLAERSAEVPETPESRASKAPAKRRNARAKKAVEA